MTLLDAIVLGVVEGITEYLPVSSTGHLILASRMLGLVPAPSDAGFAQAQRSVDAFNIAIQGAAVLAVAGLYWRRVTGMARAAVASLGVIRRGSNHRLDAVLLRNLIISFVPAAAAGLVLDEAIEARLFAPVPVIIALGLGGVVMIAVAPWVRAQARLEAAGHGATGSTLLAWQALVVGLFQVLALWPGTSRSMVTILGAMAVGLRPRAAAEYSFLLALPTLGAATLWKSKVLLEDGTIAQLGGPAPVIAGFLVSGAVAALSIAWLVAYLSRGGFALFGWWRIGLACVVAGGIWSGWLTLAPADAAAAAGPAADAARHGPFQPAAAIAAACPAP